MAECLVALRLMRRSGDHRHKAESRAGILTSYRPPCQTMQAQRRTLLLPLRQTPADAFDHEQARSAELLIMEWMCTLAYRTRFCMPGGGLHESEGKEEASLAPEHDPLSKNNGSMLKKLPKTCLVGCLQSLSPHLGNGVVSRGSLGRDHRELLHRSCMITPPGEHSSRQAATSMCKAKTSRHDHHHA